MAEFLQQHAGLHFILALVELALFRLPTEGYIAQPRILARTTNIERGIVTVDDDGRVSIKPSRVAPIQGGHSVRMTITKELYLEKLERQFRDISISERLSRFIDKLARYDVKPEFGTDSMILRWRPDDTRNWNLGYITTGGKVFTDILGGQAYEAGLLDAQKRYVENLAALVPGTVIRPSEKQGAWGAYNDDGVITIDTMLADESRENGWLDAIAEFQRTVTKRLQGDPTEPNLTKNPAMPREVVLESGRKAARSSLYENEMQTAIGSSKSKQTKQHSAMCFRKVTKTVSNSLRKRGTFTRSKKRSGYSTNIGGLSCILSRFIQNSSMLFWFK